MTYIHIQWYPGHIAKAQRELREKLKLVDCVVEMVDARLPISSHFKMVEEMIQSKDRIIVINKADLVPKEELMVAEKYWKDKGYPCIRMNTIKRKGLGQLQKYCEMYHEALSEKMKARGRLPRKLRTLVMGLPNVGKSSLINALIDKRSMKVGNKPGVTRSMRWISIAENLELLDSPGVIPPKFNDQNLALKLALIGSVSEHSASPLEVAEASLDMLREEFPEMLIKVYGSKDVRLENIAESMGHYSKNGEPNIKRSAKMFLKDFRAGKIAKMILETERNLSA